MTGEVRVGTTEATRMFLNVYDGLHQLLRFHCIFRHALQQGLDSAFDNVERQFNIIYSCSKRKSTNIKSASFGTDARNRLELQEEVVELTDCANATQVWPIAYLSFII